MSMESLSMNTTIFHGQTHKNGAPIELDSSLPNNFAKVQKEVEAGPPVVTVTKGQQGLALLQRLKTPAGKKDDLLTDRAITASAQRQTDTPSPSLQSQSQSQSPKSSSGIVVSSNYVLEERSSLVLYAPSDITGERRHFLKQ